MSGRDSDGGRREGASVATPPREGRLHALGRGGEEPMELFWHYKYSGGHHEYSVRYRFADRLLRELEMTRGIDFF